MDEPADHEPLDVLQDLGASEGDVMGDLSATPSFLRAAAGTGRSQHLGERARAVLPQLGVEDAQAPDPGAIPMATISPRRLLHIVGVLALTWGVISFGRQVATASAASAHADELRAANATIQAEVTAMQQELTLIQEQRYVELEARAYRLGSPNEIPFALQPGASPLPADAPGSASQRLGAEPDSGGPLETWLRILFGPG